MGKRPGMGIINGHNSVDRVDQGRTEKTCRDGAESKKKQSHCWCRLNVDGRKVEIRCNLDWMQYVGRDERREERLGGPPFVVTLHDGR